ncbi:hypothetical protein HYH03_002154 [Edaphochlamys debaryana]|uniref:Uncharacterized protein n=1 Tax=Edaphochlamys debaryana TaxID=47281 RepID=A0A835YBY5_9CHLO|nr:hypothetical protein HYH03_002154 [Edaphochlamys debaryana]|eukprot:KAG2499863.1 hypothetical protein HYH03_002154 [Edaphochlamys debaryana]
MSGGMLRGGASPGGPMVSAAKRRRLAALDDVLAARQAGSAPTSAPPSRPGSEARGTGPTPGTVPPAEFPYNPLEASVLDGALSAALAQAKAAAEAAAAAAAPIEAPSGPASRRKDRGASAAVAAASAAAAAAAAAGGGGSVAAEVLAELVGTNPRASGSDLRGLLQQRLADRSVLLDNPTATLRASKLFARRTTSHSSRLRSNARAKAEREDAQEGGGKERRVPSYEAMLKVHQLWLHYTRGLARGPSGPGGASAGPAASTAGEAPARQVELLGAMVTVVRHRNPQLMGATGVVLRRSAAALHLVCPGDRLRVVPLPGCTAHYEVNGTTLQLTG